jgi:hypothetical protein
MSLGSTSSIQAYEKRAQCVTVSAHEVAHHEFIGRTAISPASFSRMANNACASALVATSNWTFSFSLYGILGMLELPQVCTLTLRERAESRES